MTISGHARAQRMLNRVAVQFGNANAGAKDVKVLLARNDAQGAVFTIHWSA